VTQLAPAGQPGGGGLSTQIWPQPPVRYGTYNLIISVIHNVIVHVSIRGRATPCAQS